MSATGADPPGFVLTVHPYGRRKGRGAYCVRLPGPYPDGARALASLHLRGLPLSAVADLAPVGCPPTLRAEVDPLGARPFYGGLPWRWWSLPERRKA